VADRYAQSRTQHERARGSLAGGVGSSFRAPQLPVPISFARGTGSRLWDVDGNVYIDYALAFGPMLLGHSPEPVIEAVCRQLEAGVGYGACHRKEAELAEILCRIVPCAELCAFSCTGSEAVHAAVRIARSATGRNRVIKFLGQWHGWFDPLSVGAPGKSDASPTTGGQDPLASSAVTVCGWNDLRALEEAMSDDVAAVIMEPLGVNGGCLASSPGYLEGVRALTRRAGAVLVFDEVITGFRLALGGAQERFEVVPDLAVFGKALGSGFPISVVAGTADVMDEVVSGRVSHAGTLNTNPVCTTAAAAAVGELERRAPEIYPHLEAMGTGLAALLREECADAGLPLAVNQLGGMGYAFCSDRAVDDYTDTLAADAETYRLFAKALLDEGVHVISRGLLYVSTAHSEADLEKTREAARRAAATTREMLDRAA
jgi:glutamate-1-semialdehyde 2,1-aminomutase